MRGTINEEWAEWLSLHSYFYVMHRFDGITVPFVRMANEKNWRTISISTGVNEESLRELQQLEQDDCQIDYITIDVAHGHHSKVRDRIEEIKDLFPKAYVIAGNAATAQATIDLENWGADATKCLIGTGSACSTRYQTGFYIPAFSCIQECAKWAKKPIIADGGIKHYGDIAKALVAGASFVMSGNLFASCFDSPAPESNGLKVYYGNASASAKGVNRHVEGFELEIEKTGLTLQERLKEITQALQSSISYGGGDSLEVFQRVQYVSLK